MYKTANAAITPSVSFHSLELEDTYNETRALFLRSFFTVKKNRPRLSLSKAIIQHDPRSSHHVTEGGFEIKEGYITNERTQSMEIRLRERKHTKTRKARPRGIGT